MVGWHHQGDGREFEDEMVGGHHRLDGREFEQTPGVGDGRGGLACCSPWDCRESRNKSQDTAEQQEIMDDFPALLNIKTEQCKQL